MHACLFGRFRDKYHPDDAARHTKETQNSAKRRLRVFLDLLKKGHFDDISLDSQNADDIVKLLDKVVIKLEGGNDSDLAVLDMANSQTEEESGAVGKKGEDSQESVSGVLSPSSVPLPAEPPPGLRRMGENGPIASADLTPEQRKLQQEAQNYQMQQQQQPARFTLAGGRVASKAAEAIARTKLAIKKEKRRKHREPYHYDDDDDEEEEESDSDSDWDAPEPAPPGEDSDQAIPAPANEEDVKEDVSSTSATSTKLAESTSSQQDVDEKNKPANDSESDVKPPGVEDDIDQGASVEKEPFPPGVITSGVGDENDEIEAAGSQDDDKVSKKGSSGDVNPSTASEDTPVEDMADKSNHKQNVEKDTRENASKNDESKAVDSTTEEIRNTGIKPRALHRTLSLFLRNVPPNVTKGDIVAVCKRYPGFMRVAMADPSPDRRFHRRVWITFDSSVNIKDICWNLSNIRIKDIEMNPVVNRDLSKRVRPITGITLAKQVVHFDLKFASKLVAALDEKFRLYYPSEVEVKEDDMETESEAVQEDADTTDTTTPKDHIDNFPIPEANPVLRLVPDLRDDVENSAGTDPGEKEGEAGKDREKEVDFSRDDQLLKVLDRLVLYLRIVHSLDYYNGVDYPHEDEMPNRCGIIHIRGTQPDKASPSEVSEWKKNIEQKLSYNLITTQEVISEKDAEKLGKKDSNSEVENFVSANTHELAKDKWLCPLSGKKFKGPEFVRKHIFNKHTDKLDAVKVEVEFFNRYLFDPKRPHFPDQSQGRDSSVSNSAHSGTPNQFTPQQPMYQMGWNPRGPHMMYGPRGPFTPPAYGGFRGGPDMHSRGAGHTYPPKPRRGGMMRESRSLVTYKDLDAPDEADFF